MNKQNAYKRWYGIPGLEFIWHGEWADPEIRVHGCKKQKEYHITIGKTFNSHIVEDTMWERFTEICKEYNIDPDRDEGFNFENYMWDNIDDIWELIHIAVKQKLVEGSKK